jgi:hypothetical protein
MWYRRTHAKMVYFNIMLNVMILLSFIKMKLEIQPERVQINPVARCATLSQGRPQDFCRGYKARGLVDSPYSSLPFPSLPFPSPSFPFFPSFLFFPYLPFPLFLISFFVLPSPLLSLVPLPHSPSLSPV